MDDTRWILGISAYYHDSAAVLLANGEIIAAAAEERFTRQKGDASFPARAVAYCLREGGIAIDDLAAVGFYEKPILKFDRLLVPGYGSTGILAVRTGWSGVDQGEALARSAIARRTKRL